MKPEKENRMTTDQLYEKLKGKSLQEIMNLAQQVHNPMEQLKNGEDMSNIHIQTIPGAVRFCVFESIEDKTNPEKYSVGYVAVVNGPKDDSFLPTEDDLKKKSNQKGIDGLRNTRVIFLK